MSCTKIPTRPADAQRAAYVANIIAAYRAATPEQTDAGHRWYPQAHDMATWMAGDPVVGAGVLAAFSANTGWGRTVNLAVKAFSTGEPSGHTGAVISKARAIMAGVDPASVLPMTKKTGHFFQAIANPSDPHPVVIDRHAHDLAVGVRFGNDDRGLDNLNRYNSLVDAYRAAATELGELPSVVQAVTWVAWREPLTARRGDRVAVSA